MNSFNHWVVVGGAGRAARDRRRRLVRTSPAVPTAEQGAVGVERERRSRMRFDTVCVCCVCLDRSDISLVVTCTEGC